MTKSVQMTEQVSNVELPATSRAVFGNPLPPRQIRRIARFQQRVVRKLNYQPGQTYHLGAVKNDELGSVFNMETIVRDEAAPPILPENAVICATARSGFGPHRAALAIVSCASALGLKAYWLDLVSIPGTPSELMTWWDREYSLLSRFSQRNRLFNRYAWEHITSGEPTPWPIAYVLDSLPRTWSWKYLKLNVKDSSVTALLADLYRALPSNLPVLTTHPWNAQAAVAAGHSPVYNLVLDNWPVAFWLAEGAQHLVQTPSAYYGYRTMMGFTPDNRSLDPIPADEIHHVGHFIDHELVSNIEEDCTARVDRAYAGEARRFLLSMGGAGAQQMLFKAIVEHLAPAVRANRAALFVNLGDHRGQLDWLLSNLSAYRDLITIHETWEQTTAFVETIRTGSAEGIHFFVHDSIFHAVYATNHLMRVSDVLITKPSELAFYPIPKLLNQRVGGHEAGGAIRSSELGEGTPEMRTIADTLQALDLLINDPALLEMYCDSIRRNFIVGQYNGGYQALRMAVDDPERPIRAGADS